MGHGPVRIRYRRLCAVGGSVAVTALSLLAATGVVDVEGDTRPVARAVLASGSTGSDAGSDVAPDAADTRTPDGVARPGVVVEGARFRAAQDVRAALAAEALEVPPASGSGRRVVFDSSAQRVWLVGSAGRVRRTYPVSGSLTDNLQPGSYEVWSRSRRAWGIDDSGSMTHFVRFAHGERAAIGFHDIPVKDGVPVQTRAELGTPQSHGCIRQWRSDARALWDFAPLGTQVVVVA